MSAYPAFGQPEACEGAIDGTIYSRDQWSTLGTWKNVQTEAMGFLCHKFRARDRLISATRSTCTRAWEDQLLIWFGEAP